MASITIKPCSSELHCANLLDHILCHEPDSMTIVAGSGSGQHQVSFNAPLLCTLSPLLTDLAKQSLRDKCCSSYDQVYVYLPDLRNWKILKLLKTFLSCGVVDYISKSDAENLQALLETLGINISTEVDVSHSVREEAEAHEQQFVVAIKYEVEANGNYKGTEKSFSSTVIKVEKDQYEEIKKLLDSAKNIGTRISTEIEDTEEGDETAETDTHLDFLEENAQIDADRSYDYETHNAEQIEKAVMEDSETGAPVISPYIFKSAALPSNAGKSKHTLRKKVIMEKRYLPNRKTKVADNFREQLTECAKTKRLPKTQNNVIPIKELYSCSKCNFKTKHKSSLEKHQRVHGVMYPCSKCDYTGIKSNLKKHEKSDHKYPCNQCDYIAVRNQNLRIHIESAHEKVQYPCSQCEYKATRKANLKQHFDSIHAKIEYFCSQCNYKAKQRVTLKQHVASEHDGIRYPCDKCDFRAKRKDALTRHYKKVHK